MSGVARALIPALFFLGGFLWDTLTLGIEIRDVDLWILLGYYAAAAILLFLIGRQIEFRFAPYLNLAFQFFIGNIFSALVIFYFLSSSDVPGFLLVGILVALLVGNEFLQSRYGQITLGWTMFSLAGIMLFNFALPHLFRSVGRAWFYISTAIAIAVVVALKRSSREERAVLWPAFVAASIVVALYLANAIPPVPLVKQEMLIAHSLARQGNKYVGLIERRGVVRDTVHRRGGEAVYCFTSIFAPARLDTTIVHRWQYWHDGEWKTSDRVGFGIRGGRRGGYRGYSVKRNVTPGDWRVVAESETGQRIGVLRFRVVEGKPSLRRVTL